MNNEPITRPQAILNLQRYLRQLSYFDESIFPPPLTGTWDARTEESLMAFQKKHRLPQTGRADDVTWNLLYDEYKRSVERAAHPRSLPLFPLFPDGYEIGMGEESFAVMAIQYMLGEIGVQYDNLERVAQTGIYDSDTDTAIREFQTRNLLPATGKVNKTTWDFLVSAYEIIYRDNKQ